MCESTNSCNTNTFIKVVSHNTRGMKNVTIPLLLERFDIILLQETLLCKQDLGSLNSLSPHFFGTGVAVTDTSTGIIKGRPKGGVAVLYKKSFCNFVTQMNFGLDWVTGISLSLPNEDVFYILTVYMPYNSSENEDEFLEKLGILVSLVNDIDSPFIWIVGDFNAHIGNSPSNFGRYLIDTCIENDLVFSSKILLPFDSFTYISDMWNSTSWLDHCISTESSHDRICNFSVEYELADSDNFPISFQIQINSAIESKLSSNTPTYENIIWDKLTPDQIPNHQERWKFFLTQIETPSNALHCSDFNCKNELHIESYWKYYYEIVESLQKASVPLVKFFRNRPKPFPGWTHFVKEAHSVSIAALKQWRRGGKPKNGILFVSKKESHKRFKNAVRQAKRREQYSQQNILAEKLCEGKSKDFWKNIRKLKGDNKVSATSINGVCGDSEICQLWKSHYENLFNGVSQGSYQIDHVKRDYTAIVTSTELHGHIWSLNITKSPGPDSISAEHLKFAPALLCNMLAKCFSTIFIHGVLPRKMLDVHLVPIVKDNRSKLTSIENYRPIAKASCISKLLELCILHRIENFIQAAENQFGFKKAIGTDSCIYVLKEILNKFKRTNTNTFLAFLDASKAFDRIRHDLLFTKLQNSGVPIYIIRVLKDWYENQSMFAKWNNSLSDSFSCQNGVKQGGVLSPYLFNFYFDNLSQKLNNLNIGCHLNTTINHLFYADDLVLIAPTKNGLQKLIMKCESFSIDHSVQFNLKKVKL